MPSSQRPFFLSSFLAAFRPQAPPSASALSSQSKTHTHAQSSSSSGSAPGAARGIASSTPVPTSSAASTTTTGAGGVMNQLNPIHSPRAGGHGVPIPATSPGSRGQRRGSDSSSEGFRDARGADKWYIGGRTAGGEEKFFKLGVVKRVRSNDRLSLDRLSL
ncbi:hypothetical protein PG997_007505 [Apiospora hydei]|uniref:Uncharacterized protein n=1 Tax=Apiospora hydei TaxID=1337664 RepID=A0ABR1W9H3_9PEZI